MKLTALSEFGTLGASRQSPTRGFVRSQCSAHVLYIPLNMYALATANTAISPMVDTVTTFPNWDPRTASLTQKCSSSDRYPYTQQEITKSEEAIERVVFGYYQTTTSIVRTITGNQAQSIYRGRKHTIVFSKSILRELVTAERIFSYLTGAPQTCTRSHKRTRT